MRHDAIDDKHHSLEPLLEIYEKQGDPDALIKHLREYIHRFAATGGLFVILSSILGWIGVAVTGSDTSSNALFGALQVQTAARTGLDPLLFAAANSSSVSD